VIAVIPGNKSPISSCILQAIPLCAKSAPVFPDFDAATPANQQEGNPLPLTGKGLHTFGRGLHTRSCFFGRHRLTHLYRTVFLCLGTVHDFCRPIYCSRILDRNFSATCGEVGGWRSEVGGKNGFASNLKRSDPQASNSRPDIGCRQRPALAIRVVHPIGL
jgi:hypothetical protein